MNNEGSHAIFYYQSLIVAILVHLSHFWSYWVIIGSEVILIAIFDIYAIDKEKGRVTSLYFTLKVSELIF